MFIKERNLKAIVEPLEFTSPLIAIETKFQTQTQAQPQATGKTKSKKKRERRARAQAKNEKTEDKQPPSETDKKKD